MKLETRIAEIRDVPEIKRMIDEYLAVDYYSIEELERCVRREQSLFYVVTDEDRGGAMAAFFYALAAPLDEALRILHVKEKPEALLGYRGDTRVGVYKTASTAEGYQRCGICSSFICGLEPVMRKRGAKMILATAMRSPAGVVPMKRIFHDYGFEPIAEIYHPWEDMYMYCPYCGRHHCICDAVFYMKRLDETEDENVRK